MELKIRHVLSIVEFENLDSYRREPFWAPLCRLYEIADVERGWIEWEGGLSWVKIVLDSSSGILYCNLSVPDLSDPKFLEKLVPPVDPVEFFCLATLYIQNCVDLGNVLVHCTKGQRRSPTVFLAWLATQGYSLTQAMRYFEEHYEGGKEWVEGYYKSRSSWIELLERFWYPNWREYQRKFKYSASFGRVFERFRGTELRGSAKLLEECEKKKCKKRCLSGMSEDSTKKRVRVVTQKMVPKLWISRVLKKSVLHAMRSVVEKLQVNSAYPRLRMGKIVTVPSGASVQSALETMLENELRSIISFRDVKDPNSICCIEISDILKIILDLYSESDAYIERDLMYILKNSDHSSLKKLRAIDISNIANNASFAVVQEGSSILSVASSMGANGVRRVFVVNDEGKLVNVITQSSVLELLMEHRQELGDKLDQTLFQLGCGGKHVIYIRASDPTIVGFRKIVDNRVTAVAVVDDETEELIGSINIRDIESLVHANQRIKVLYERADAFLQKSPNSMQGQNIFCTPLSTIREVLEKMHSSNSRRLWICNKKKAPIGVVTITDLIELVSPNNNSTEKV